MGIAALLKFHVNVTNLVGSDDFKLWKFDILRLFVPGRGLASANKRTANFNFLMYNQN